MKYKSSVYKSFVLVMQFGINMLVPIFLCMFIGVWLGNKTGIDFISVPLFAVGALAGFRNCYIMAKKAYQDEDNKGHKDKKDVKKIK